MQLVSEQCVKLHDSNVKLVIAIHQQRSCNEFDPLNYGSDQTILSMDVCDRVLNFNPQGHVSQLSHMRRILQPCSCELIKFDF
jgi:hypothetical protein